MAISGGVWVAIGDDEQAKLRSTAPQLELPSEQRQFPPLPAPAQRRDVLGRAFLANGELESAYFVWKAALARVDQAATGPNSNLAVSFDYLFSSGNMKAWDRTTLGVGFDPSMNLSLPGQGQDVRPDRSRGAREAGEGFRTIKFDLQRQVLSAYLDLALIEEKIRIARDSLDLLRLLTSSAASRAAAMRSVLNGRDELLGVDRETLLKRLGRGNRDRRSASGRRVRRGAPSVRMVHSSILLL